MITEVRKTYKFRMYRHDKRDKHLHQMINVAGLIWNHALALQRRYYRIYGQYIPLKRLKAHIAKLRMGGVRPNKRMGRKAKNYGKRFTFWQVLGSQAVQDILERLDEAYQKFFKKQGGFPRFKKVKKYKSFTLKQTSGWELLEADGKRYSRIRIGEHVYKFVQHRSFAKDGTIKTVTIKRDSCGRLWLCFSVIEKMNIPEKVSTGKSGGFDFGLKTFLTDHTGKQYMSSEYFKQQLERVKKLSRAISRKVKGSRNRRNARWLLDRAHIRMADKRRDFHFKLAHTLCDDFEVLVFETLNMAAMKRLWGRKVSDLSFSQFLEILEWVAFKRGKSVVYVERFSPTTQTCSGCGQRKKLPLKERVYDCEHCGLVLDRDHNAAINIQRAGASAHTARGASDTLRGAASLTAEAQML